MAIAVEAWWSANYNKYSIRDLQRLPIFHRFVQIHYPFERSDDVHHERFYVEAEEVDVFEWTDKKNQRFERFQHDKKKNEYHYELRFRDDESPVTIRSWLQGELEWGTVVRDYGTFKLQEGWRLEPPNRSYERFTEEQGIKKGFRAGIHPLKGDYERWVEDIWEFGEERMFKKQWHKEGEEGGETTNQRGNYTWGENWSGTPKRFEKKCWHKDGDHTWGHDLGKEPPRRWDHTWDFQPDEKYEEKVTVTAGRDTGYRYWGSKGDWYKQEWEGVKMLEREDRCEEVISAKLRERLDNLFQQELSSSLGQQQLLALLGRFLPAYEDKVQKLGKALEAVQVQDPGNVESVLDRLEATRQLGNEQEELLKDMFGGFREDFNMLQVFNTVFLTSINDSMQTLARIGELINDNSAHEEYVSKAQEYAEMQGGTVAKGKRGLELMAQIEQVKRDELDKFKGGIPQEEVEKAMETLYQIMVKHDAVSDKIVELTHANDFKEQLDHMEDQFGEIHEHYLQEGDPDKLHQMLNLLLEYQPIHLHLMNRLRGYTKEESNSEIGAINTAVEQTKSAPSLKNTRAKVRSGRPPRETPFQTMENHLNRFAPLLQRLLAAVDAPQSSREAVDAMVQKTVTSAEPVDVVMEKTKFLADMVPEVTPSVEKHENTLRETDQNVNSALEWSYPFLALLPNDSEELQKRQTLVQKSEETSYFPPLLLEKTAAIQFTGPDLSQALQTRLDSLSNLQDQVEALNQEIQHFVPQYASALKSLGTAESTRQPLDALQSFSAENHAQEAVEKLHVLNKVAETAQPDIEEHDAALRKTDEHLNFALESGFPYLEKVEGGPEAVAARQRLISESSSSDYFPPLLFLKSKHLQEYTPAISQHLATQQSLLLTLQQGNQQVVQACAELNAFLPLYVLHLQSVGVSQELVTQVEALERPVSSPETAIPAVLAQSQGLVTAATEAQAPISAHNGAIQASDAHLNQYFEDSFPQYEQIEGAEEVIIAPRRELMGRSGENYLVPVVLAKTEQLKDHSQELGLLLESYTESQTETTTQIDQINRELSERSLLIEDLRRKIKELQQRISILEPDLEEARLYKPLFENKDQENTHLALELKKITLEHSDLQLKMDATRAELEKVAGEVEDLKEFKRRAVDLEAENVRYAGIIKSYESMLGENKTQFQDIIEQLNSTISTKDAEIKELKDQIEGLKVQLEEKEQGRRKQLMLRVIGALALTIRAEKQGTFASWSVIANTPEEYPKESILDEYTSVAGFLDEELAEEVLERFAATEQPLVAERTLLLTSNIVTKHWKVNAGKFDKPATPVDTLEFWLPFISSMHSAALDDFQANKRPLPFPEFLLEHLFKTLSSKHLIHSKLATHLPALYRLFTQQHPLAVVLARMLNLYSGSPLGLEGQIVVAGLRKEFQQLAEAYEQERSHSSPISPAELALTGGMAPLEVVLWKFQTVFEDHDFFVEHWVRHLQPPSVSKADFVIALIYIYLQGAHIDPADFWSEVVDSSGVLSHTLVSQQVRSSVKISTRLLQEVLSTPISKEEFLEKQSVDVEKYVVTLGSFLLGVTEAYMAKERRLAVTLRDLHGSAGVELVDKDTFERLVGTLDSAVSAELMQKVYEEALPLSAQASGLDCSSFTRILLRYPYGPFAKYPLGIEELGRLTEWHVKEFDLVHGSKITTSVTTTKVVKVTKKIVKKQ